MLKRAMQETTSEFLPCYLPPYLYGDPEPVWQDSASFPGPSSEMRRADLSLAASSALFLAPAIAQQPTLKLAATSVNVSEPGMSVRIDIFRWSIDQERSQLVTAERLSPDKRDLGKRTGTMNHSSGL